MGVRLTLSMKPCNMAAIINSGAGFPCPRRIFFVEPVAVNRAAVGQGVAAFGHDDARPQHGGCGVKKKRGVAKCAAPAWRCRPRRLASQAVGTANNPVEMSFKGRTFPQLGKKLLHPAVVPLGSQMVATDDSSLGQMSNGLNKGLNTRYADMVSQAFQPRWWNSSQCVDADKAPVADSAGCPN